jgi:capsular polysaccharide biosynthesis protein
MDRSVEPVAHDRLTVAGLLNLIRQWPKIFLATASLTVVAVIAHAFLATPIYRGSVKMMPRENELGGGALQGLVGQLGGLASIAGFNLGSVDGQEAIAWLKSRALFTLFVNKQNLMPILFRDEWDAASGRWRPDLKRIPTMDDAWAMFDKGIRQVNDDPKTRVITLEITWKDRQQAAFWANELVKLANEELRQRALRETAAGMASLQEQLSRADSVELRLSIARLMEAQLNGSVVAKSRPEYALTVLDPAVVSDARHFVSPRRFLLLVISLPLGLFVGVCAVLAVRFAREIAEQLQLSKSKV